MVNKYFKVSGSFRSLLWNISILIFNFQREFTNINWSVLNKIHVSDIFFFGAEISFANSFKFDLRQLEVYSWQNLSKLFWSNFISALSVPVFEKLFNINSCWFTEKAIRKKKKIIKINKKFFFLNTFLYFNDLIILYCIEIFFFLNFTGIFSLFRLLFITAILL